MPKRILIVAGEASTDRIGAMLIEELRRRRPDVEITGAGGPRMKVAGLRALEDPTRYASVGIVEALANARSYRRLWRLLVEHVRRDPPDVFVPIDLPGFNLRLAPVARAAGAKVVFYVSPQVWAWRAGRVREIAAVATRMLVLFRFEEAIYRDAGVPVAFVGHPFVDAVAPLGARRSLREELGIGRDETLLTLLPGSRRGSMRRLLPEMLGAAARLHGRRALRIAIGAAPGVSGDALASDAAAFGLDAAVVSGRTAELLAATDLALASSGTVTVEAALAATPMIVSYRMHAVSAFLARRVLRIDHVAMVNLLARREVVPELLQEDATAERLARRADSLLQGAPLAAMRRDLESVRPLFGPPGATARAADEILAALG